MYGLCCISLLLKEQDYSFQRITYKKFASLPREEALFILGNRILNNMVVTKKSIEFCAENKLCYRISSDLFPLITYDKAEVSLEDLPNYEEIENSILSIKNTIQKTKVRISCHPSEYNVLASNNLEAVEKTIKELNFYSKFMDRIGCPASNESPMNLHVHNKQGKNNEIANRFLENFKKLDDNCQKRLVVENDDKTACWSVKQLVEDFHPIVNVPITFDYLHHKCHPEGIDEESAFNLCYNTWNTKPLFHYSESKQGSKNPRAHADYATNKFKIYKDCDVDFELKMKDLAILKYCQNVKI